MGDLALIVLAICLILLMVALTITAVIGLCAFTVDLLDTLRQSKETRWRGQ